MLVKQSKILLVLPVEVEAAYWLAIRIVNQHTEIALGVTINDSFQRNFRHHNRTNNHVCLLFLLGGNNSRLLIITLNLTPNIIFFTFR